MSRAFVAAAASLFYAAAAHAVDRRTAIVEAVERTSPAVVGVRTQVVVASERAMDPFAWFFRDFGGQLPAPKKRVETLSQGSGVIIDPRGYVLTNYHVIAGGGDIELQLQDRRVLPATVVGTAPDHDLAVLKVETDKKLPHISMSKTDAMIGETVIAIGNPFGLSHSVTTGVVSALHRSIRTDDRVYTDFIQTDAAINPGNSGGPLLTIDGQLVGVNTAIYGKAQGIGFAIPIDKAKRIVDDLLRYGEVRRPYFGIDVQALTEELATSLGLPDSDGALVAQVDPDGPASGVVREGDVIKAIEDSPVTGNSEARQQLANFTVGSPVRLDLLREGKPLSVTVKPGELSLDAAFARLWSKIGIKVTALPQAEARRVGAPPGLIVVEEMARSGPAARVGLRIGDVIRAVNSERVLGIEQFGKAVARTYWRGQVTLLIQRGGVWQAVTFDF
jgi:serine protease Do